MLHREFDVPERLRDTIKCFWYNKRELGALQSGFEILPDGYTEIIFLFGSSCSISYSGGLRPLQSPFIMGLLNQPVVLNTKDRLEIIGIRCFPWTIFDLLGLSSGSDGMRLSEHPIAQLQPTLSRLVYANRIEEALVCLKQYLLQARSRMAVDNTLYKAGVAMREANGAIPVGQVAAAAHATVRTLERKFKQSSGYTVKDVSCLMRFEQVRNQLWLNPEASIAGLAYELGYTDQSHLSREFKRYSGATPAAFARMHKDGYNL